MDWSDILVRIMADWLVIPIFLISFVLLARVPKNRVHKTVIRAVIVLVIAFVIGRLLSLLYSGERPYLMYGVPPGAWAADNPGFPSEHALVVFALTFIVWATTHNVNMTLILVGLSFIVCVGRVVALVHTPLDVIVGAACAFIAAAIVYRQRLFKTP